MADRYTIQIERRIYNDDSGDYVSVGMDVDAIGLVELKQHDNGSQVASITVPPAQARLLALEILKYLGEVHPIEESNG